MVRKLSPENKFIRNIGKSLIFRKSVAFGKQFPRFIRRSAAKEDEYFNSPPVLANSFPKSGTHLLLQILRELPKVDYYGSFIASRNSSIILKERSISSHVRSIRGIAPGEVLPAHLFHSKIYREELLQKNCIHFFIYRDLRDCVVSEVNYITNMNRWHRLHEFYTKSLMTEEERISAMILAKEYPKFPCDYPNIGERFERYQGWLKESDVLSIKFEDLMNEKRDETLCSIVEHYLERVNLDLDVDKLIMNIKKGIRPERSHTFWKGEVGGWRKKFTDQHKDRFKLVAGEILIQLGYEKDMDW